MVIKSYSPIVSPQCSNPVVTLYCLVKNRLHRMDDASLQYFGEYNPEQITNQIISTPLIPPCFDGLLNLLKEPNKQNISKGGFPSGEIRQIADSANPTIIYR